MRKDRTTERTARCSAPSGRLLSLVTQAGGGGESLDIEAPTTLDRDKFASAFAGFLGVPLSEEGEAGMQGGGGGDASAGPAKRTILAPSLTGGRKRVARGRPAGGPSLRPPRPRPAGPRCQGVHAF